jgi:hypothetical protein
LITTKTSKRKREKTMNRVKSVVAAAALTFFIAVTTAGQAPTQCNPGETNGPPCPMALASPDDSAPQDETLTTTTVDLIEIVSIVESTLHSLLLF